jgi:hypothetical protein
MTSVLQIADIVGTFRPLEVASYLRLHGWKQQESVPERYSLWIKKDDGRGDFEVLLPMAMSFSDFPRRVRELIETLQAEEKRGLPEILEDVTTPHADIVRARLAPDGDMSGALPLEDGANVFQQMRDLMLSAACAAVSPRQVFAKRKPDQAMKYLREARIGQTQRGSYVITVLSPVPPALLAGSPPALFADMEEEPFSRKTVRILADALSATAEGVQSAAASGKLDALAAGVARGVSANLCEAILGLHEGSGGRGLEFSFSWALSRGAPANVRSVQRLQTDSMPYLEEASRHFRQTSELEGVEVFGAVHRLEHLHGDAGDVTIVGTVDGERRTVVTELQGEDHTRAIRAYEDRLAIRCFGELRKEGKSYRLRNPRDVRLVDDSS